MKKSSVRKAKVTGPAKSKMLTVKRETLKDLTPQGQHVKGGNATCGCSRSR